MFNILTKVDKSAESRRNLHTHTHTHTCNLLLRIKQIGTICFAIFSFVFSAPLFATDIPSSASTADCKHTPLQVYSGTSNLEAGWEPNTIALHWYNGDDELTVPSASQSCVYDETLTPPSTIPTKTGYTFRGWRVRVDPTCGLSSVDLSENGTAYGYTRLNNTVGSNEATYGLTTGSGEWAVSFNHGVVMGTVLCSQTPGNYLTVGTPDETNSGIYCWCKVTNYTPNGGNQCIVASNPWVASTYYPAGLDSCLSGCTSSCSFRFKDYVALRQALLGITQ